MDKALLTKQMASSTNDPIERNACKTSLDKDTFIKINDLRDKWLYDHIGDVPPMYHVSRGVGNTFFDGLRLGLLISFLR